MLQTQEGLRFKASYPETPVSEMHILLESLFEEHRAEAFAVVLNRPNDSDNKMMAQTHMTKAYLTYVTSETLPGYENGGKSFLQEFTRHVKEHLIKQEKALNPPKQ